MCKARIRLAYRMVIDHSSSALWDQYVFEDSFREYLMQQQLFNTGKPPKQTFGALLAENEKASQLHYLVGIAINGYVQQLKGNLHRITDVLGKDYFPFSNVELDIIDTDVTDIGKHKIGITFYSPLFTLVEIVNNCYLVSKEIHSENGFETLMFAVQPNLSICYYEKLQ